jgi:hypothetical protein
VLVKVPSRCSESQREFIDLAFRMALMETAAGADGDAMLVLETPEASLDSLFVTEAGALFRRFAAGGGALGNVFIASTNLNNEGMIPALFGAVTPPAREEAAEDADVLAVDAQLEPEEEPGPAVPVADRHRYLINLLNLAAPNAALRHHAAYYQEKLREAVYKDLPAGERPSLELPPHQPHRTEGAEGQSEEEARFSTPGRAFHSASNRLPLSRAACSSSC